jgi:hypothetical protein
MPQEGQKLRRRKLPGDLQGRPGLRQALPNKPPNLSANGSAMPMRMLEAALGGLDAYRDIRQARGRWARQVTQVVSDLLHEQPFLMMGTCFALGYVTAALLLGRR